MADHPHSLHPRPLSPHLSIYRWPVTMATSITHRATGLALALGTLLVAWWLVAAASGPESFAVFNQVANSIAGQVVLFGFVWSLAYHFLNGIRHLAWDLGYGFGARTAEQTGVLVFVLSLLLTVAIFAVAFAGHAGYLG